MSEPTISYDMISDRFVGIGIAVVVTGLIAGVLLQLTRRFRNMPSYFLSNFSFFKGKSPKLVIVFTVLYYLLLFTPIILHIVWVILLGVNVGANPALPVLFYGIFIGILFLPSYSKLFYFKVLALFLTFIIAEMLTLGLPFDSQDSNSFYALTAVMLTLNSIFVAICLWVMDGSYWSIPSHAPSHIKDEIRKQIKIWKQQDEPPEIVTGGLYGAIMDLSFCKRIIVLSVTYILSLGVLTIYSCVGYFSTTEAFQALVNSVAVVTTDVISFILIFITKKTGFNPIVNSLIAILMRLFIVIFSGDYWFGGYCIIYLILIIYIELLIINKYYPNHQKFPSTTVMKTNIFKMPEFAALLLLVMFGGLVFFMGNDNGQTLPTSEMTLAGTVYPFWAVGVAVILISFAAFFYLISMRIIDRARKRVRSVNFYYMGCDGCGQYYFFLILSYLFVVVIGFYLWSRVGSAIIWASCVFLPLFYQSFVLFYINWKQNDYLLLGDLEAINKKIKKRKARQQKIDNMKQSVMKKMNDGENGEGAEQEMMLANQNLNVMDKAQVEGTNFMVENYDGKSQFSDWRDDMNIFQALKEDKLLPSDKKILVSIPIMILSLLIYSIVFFFSSNGDMTAFTVSVEILVIFLGFIPVKRYFSTFEKPNLFQIISFVLAFLLNYGFGIASYLVGWNNSPAYTQLWAFINVFAVLAYASYCLIRDKGFIIPTYIVCVASIVVSYGVGILLLTLFGEIAAGIVFLGIAFYYTYGMVVFYIYTRMNKSLPFVIYIVTFVVIVATCFAVMIYAFVADDFDNFYGFSITYLVINVIILLYAASALFADYLNRYDRPNFFSAYGSPIYKYNPEINSVVQNLRPMRAWLGGWFMFFVYCLLLMIFLVDSDVGVSASQIFLIVFYLTFIYFTTYNLYRAGRIKKEITHELMEKAWEEVVSIKEKSLGTFLDIDEIEQKLKEYREQRDNNAAREAPSSVKINPKDRDVDHSSQNKPQNKQQNKQSNKQQNNKETNKNSEQVLIPKEQSKDIDLIIFELQNKLEKAKQNDKILLVDFYTKIIFRCESIRKKNMVVFNNFIRESAQVLADGGIAIVLDETLYDIESVYNEAYQEYMALSPIQKIYFNKQMKIYQDKKKEEEKKKEQMNDKQNENQIKRMKELEKKLLDDNLGDDSDLPVEKMRDSPAKYQKLKETLTTEYTDNQFRANNDILPPQSRAQCKAWKRPSPDSVVFKEGDSGMSVRQGMIGDCYLISAIGVLGRDRVKQIMVNPAAGPPGAYLVKFNKFNKDLYVMIDSQFPVYDTSKENQWLFGRCEDEKELFCNILEKAYAKLYGGYQNIVGGKVALALADITGGFPEQIELKQYQEQNTNQIFEKMLQFKQAGYLMGAGTPPHEMGDSAEIDGIFQGHAYLVLDVRNLDGNKIIKVRNPHGNNSQQSTLDWSDDSPKWTKRLKGLINEEMGADGAFWIGLQDFVYCYRALYVCRIFDNTFVKAGPIKGAWTGKKAAGLKSSKGRAQLEDNPHYGIRVTKKCTLFVQLTQNQLEGGRAKNKIFFMVQRNNGRRIEAPSTNKMAGMSGPAINSRTISKQITLEADSFPYTFSLMTAIFEEGVEGTFTLSMYCNDKNMSIVEDDAFDV